MNIQLTTADLQEKEGLLTEAIQEKIDELHQQGGGRITFSAGRYPTGALFLKSNIELHLLLGATLVFSDDPKDYPVVVSRWEGVKREVYASCLYAENAENIAVTGLGMLDGQGQRWWKTFRENREQLAYPRPK
ncbi:MAG: glycoside hydrolase family 28 protein, partial [Enterococcus casseliflavus]